MNRQPEAPDGSEFLFYTSPDGSSRVQVRLLSETVWLTQMQMAELFQKDVRIVNEHIRNVFEEGELNTDSVIRKFRITASYILLYSSQESCACPCSSSKPA